MKKKPKAEAKSKPKTTTGQSARKARKRKPRHLEGLFEMEGLGKQYWKGVDPDEFVRKLREGWE